MPSLGADMEAGTLVEWLVKPGDWVKRGDIVAVVETQKGAIEIETFQAGRIEQFLVELDSKVPVGTPLALIKTEGEAKGVTRTITPPPAEVHLVPPPLAPSASPAMPVATTIPPPVAPCIAARVRASPAARRFAEEHGI